MTTATPATPGIDEVVTRLDGLVAADRAVASRAGFFAAVYRQTSRAVRDRVVAGAFDDGGRMDRFAATFAGRYLGPRAAWAAGQPVPRAWRAAFEADADAGMIVLQHLLLGINAHINLDLAVAAATVCPGAEIASLHDDFQRVNAVLGALMGPVRACLDHFSPLLDVLDRVGGHDDDAVLNFSIDVARDEAWTQAVALAGVADDALRAPLVDSLDRRVAVLARLVASPGGLLEPAVHLVAATESHDVVAVIDALAQVILPAP